MQFSEQYLRLLREFEGFFANPYLCTAGKCTIGYGTNLEAHRKFIPFDDLRKGTLTGRALRNVLINRGMVWSREEAERVMLDELSATEAELRRRCPAYAALLEKGEACRANALLDMAYNMGVAGLLTFKNTLKFVLAGDYAQAARNMRQSRWFGQVGRRGRAVVSMMETGRYPTELK
jgi:lysozyme